MPARNRAYNAHLTELRQDAKLSSDPNVQTSIDIVEALKKRRKQEKGVKRTQIQRGMGLFK